MHTSSVLPSLNSSSFLPFRLFVVSFFPPPASFSFILCVDCRFHFSAPFCMFINILSQLFVLCRAVSHQLYSQPRYLILFLSFIYSAYLHPLVSRLSSFIMPSTYSTIFCFFIPLSAFHLLFFQSYFFLFPQFIRTREISSHISLVSLATYLFIFSLVFPSFSVSLLPPPSYSVHSA